MKRLKLLLLFGLMLPLLASCGKSEEATLVDNLILNIGQVTLDSGAKIREAEKATKELDEKQYKQLEYLSVLQEARNTYDNLRDEKRINDIEEAIGSIGEVTLESEQNIKKIRNQYDTSNDKVKQGIKNYAILEEAEQVISSIKIQNVTNLIEQIGNVTLDSKEIIDTAKSAYSKLSFEEQELVSNYNLLEEALDKMEALKEQAEQQEVENALSKLKKEVDKVENITWYHPETYPEYANTRSYMLPYIGVRDRSEWIRLVFHYTGSDWVFFEKITISVDGENYYKTYDYYDVSRDNKSRYVWEWVDIVPDATDLVMLRDIANSQETIVRFEGDNGYKDIVISKADKAAIEDVLDAYSKIKSH